MTNLAERYYHGAMPPQPQSLSLHVCMQGIYKYQAMALPIQLDRLDAKVCSSCGNSLIVCCNSRGFGSS